MDILKVENLTKVFGQKRAVDEVSFSLKEGEILGLLGPNGAGKTTTIQMLLGVLEPTSGSIHYFGKEFMKHREEILEKVNFSSAYTNFMWWLSLKENLQYLSYLYDIPNRKEKMQKIIKTFFLEEIYNKEMEQLSSGQLTRANLAKAFLNSPKVLLLDEPTASLDPEIAQYVREFILQERKNTNISIIITSHNMAEVEELCDRVIVIKDGTIVANDTPHELAKSMKDSHVELLISHNENKLLEYLKENKIEYTNKHRLFILELSTQKIPSLLEDITKRDIKYDELSVEKPTLEDFFLHTIGKKYEIT